MATDCHTILCFTLALGLIVMLVISFSECGRIQSSVNDQISVCAQKATNEVDAPSTDGAETHDDAENDVWLTPAVSARMGHVTASDSSAWGNDERKRMGHAETPDSSETARDDDDGVFGAWTEMSTDADNFKKIDIARAKNAANTRSHGSTSFRSGTMKKGMQNPLLLMYHGNNGEDDIQFSKSCSWFNATDEYHEARQKQYAGACAE